MIKRLDYDGNTYDDVYQYYHARSLQLAWNQYKWSKQLIPFDGGYITSFMKDQKTFSSFYIIDSERGKNKWKNAFDLLPGPIVTVSDCSVERFLKDHSIPYVIETGIYDYHEYDMIQQYYHNQKAKRSRVWLMNHIDEGLLVINKLGGSIDAQLGYCLHPMIQNDQDLKANYDFVVANASTVAIGYALEYRNIANQYLSHKVVEQVPTSALDQVNLMLCGDKIQNYKDFILYHRGTHQNSEVLDQYFQRWLKHLNIDNFDQWFEYLKQF